MIITLTGKPCSGKGTIVNIFCSEHGFSKVSAGKIFREVALSKGIDIQNFQDPELTKKVDEAVDNKLIEIGKTHAGEKLIIDSRTAWHFIPNSFKVYVDVSWDEASKRLVKAERESERVESIEEAEMVLKKRYVEENARYKKIYNIDCTNMKNFDFVIDSTSLTPSQVAEKIYNAYQKFVKKSKTR